MRDRALLTAPGSGLRPERAAIRPLLYGVIGFAIVLRLLTAFVLGDRADPISGAADQHSYDVLAQRVLAGQGFSFPSAWYPFTQPNQPTAHWSYAYTLYLAGVYAVAGHHPLAARLLQALLSGFIYWFIFRIGRRLFDDRVGVVAAALAAAYAYLVFFNAVLMTQTFYIVALLAALDRGLGLAAEPTPADWRWLGLALGFGILFRQTLLLFTPVLLAWILWSQRGRVRWRGPLTAVAIIAALVLPWTIYNWLTFRSFLLLNSNGGFWFYSSNHPNQGTHFDPNYVAPLPVLPPGLSEPLIDRALYRKAIGFIIADPTRFLLLTLSRIPHYFWLLPSRQSSFMANAARLCSFTLYLPFVLYGLYLSRRHWRACVPLYLYVAFDTVLHLASWAAPRYRLPSDAVMMVFAGVAVAQLASRTAKGATSGVVTGS